MAQDGSGTSRLAQVYSGGLRYIKLDSAVDTQAQARLVELGLVQTGPGYAIYRFRKSAPGPH